MLDVGEGNLVYWEVCGNPAGKPAVVLHGGPGSGCVPDWRRYFNPSEYRVVLFDQRWIPGVLIHGRMDLSSPIDVPWQLSQAWPGSQLIVVEDAGHGSGERGIRDALIGAIDRFAAFHVI